MYLNHGADVVEEQQDRRSVSMVVRCGRGERATPFYERHCLAGGVGEGVEVSVAVERQIGVAADGEEGRSWTAAVVARREG